MDTIKIIKIESFDGIEVEHVIIDRGNDEFTSMLKSTYDEFQKQNADVK